MRKRSRKGAPGILEVAARANVSAATVSRFYNKPDIVKGKTRHKIEKAAADLGYIRNRMAGAMHHGFSKTIGLIVPTIDNAIFAELIQGFSNRLLVHDHTMLIAAHGYNLNMEAGIVRSLLERRIDGVALIGLDHETAPIEMLASRNVPVLAMWNYRKKTSIPCVGADNFEAGFQVAHYIQSKGHEDIALVFAPSTANDRAQDRLDGVLSALGLSRQELNASRLIECRYDIGEAKKAMIAMLNKPEQERPTAIICGNDVLAQGAIYACQNLGIKIPDDISIIGIGDFRGSSHMEPGLTTWRLPAQKIGEYAADMLCGQRPLPNFTPSYSVHAGQANDRAQLNDKTNIKIEAELMVRDSVAQR